MGKVLISSIGMVLLFAAAGCKPGGGGDSMGSMKGGDRSMNSSSPSTMPTAMTYTCSMHPEVVSDKPGKCPKCGMDLVAKK